MIYFCNNVILYINIYIFEILIFFLLIDTFKKAVKALGGLEILVNNADVTNETDFMKTIDVNVVSKNIIF